MNFANRILPFLLMTMLVTLPGYAQTGGVEGKALDNEGKPMPNLTVTIDRMDLAGHFEVKTDRSGIFRASLPIGTYKVTLMRDGAPVDFIQGLRVTSGAPVKADFDMRELATRARADEAGSAEERAKRDAEKAKQEAVKGAFDAGVAAMTAKNYDEAARQFQTASEADPSRDIIFANLGMALSSGRKYDDAAAAYKKAIELKPTEAAYYNNLGIAYGNAGKMDDAVAALQKSAEINPAGAGQAYYNLGAMLTNRGRTKEAGDAFKKAIEFDPTNAPAYYQLGISYFGSPATMGDAVAPLQKYLELEPNGQDAEAAKQLIEAARTAPNAPTTFKSEKAIAAEKAAAEKAEKAKAEQDKAKTKQKTK